MQKIADDAQQAKGKEDGRYGTNAPENIHVETPVNRMAREKAAGVVAGDVLGIAKSAAQDIISETDAASGAQYIKKNQNLMFDVAPAIYKMYKANGNKLDYEMAFGKAGAGIFGTARHANAETNTALKELLGDGYDPFDKKSFKKSNKQIERILEKDYHVNIKSLKLKDLENALATGKIKGAHGQVINLADKPKLKALLAAAADGKMISGLKNKAARSNYNPVKATFSRAKQGFQSSGLDAAEGFNFVSNQVHTGQSIYKGGKFVVTTSAKVATATPYVLMKTVSVGANVVGLKSEGAKKVGQAIDSAARTYKQHANWKDVFGYVGQGLKYAGKKAGQGAVFVGKKAINSKPGQAVAAAGRGVGQAVASAGQKVAAASQFVGRRVTAVGTRFMATKVGKGVTAAGKVAGKVFGKAGKGLKKVGKGLGIFGRGAAKVFGGGKKVLGGVLHPVRTGLRIATLPLRMLMKRITKGLAKKLAKALLKLAKKLGEAFVKLIVWSAPVSVPVIVIIAAYIIILGAANNDATMAFDAIATNWSDTKLQMREFGDRIGAAWHIYVYNDGTWEKKDRNADMYLGYYDVSKAQAINLLSSTVYGAWLTNLVEYNPNQPEAFWGIPAHWRLVDSTETNSKHDLEYYQNEGFYKMADYMFRGAKGGTVIGPSSSDKLNDQLVWTRSQLFLGNEIKVNLVTSGIEVYEDPEIVMSNPSWRWTKSGILHSTHVSDIVGYNLHRYWGPNNELYHDFVYVMDQWHEPEYETYMDEEIVIVKDKKGKTVYKTKTDEDGNTLLDEEGNPIYLLDKHGQKIPMTKTIWTEKERLVKEGYWSYKRVSTWIEDTYRGLNGSLSNSSKTMEKAAQKYDETEMSEKSAALQELKKTLNDNIFLTTSYSGSYFEYKDDNALKFTLDDYEGLRNSICYKDAEGKEVKYDFSTIQKALLCMTVAITDNQPADFEVYKTYVLHVFYELMEHNSSVSLQTESVRNENKSVSWYIEDSQKNPKTTEYITAEDNYVSDPYLNVNVYVYGCSILDMMVMDDKVTTDEWVQENLRKDKLDSIYADGAHWEGWFEADGTLTESAKLALEFYSLSDEDFDEAFNHILFMEEAELLDTLSTGK